MNFFQIPFKAVSSEFDETCVPFEKDIFSYTQKLAKGKASEVAKKHHELPVLAADTSVCCGGRIYNKPQSLAEGVAFLTQLSGKWHEVVTSVCVTYKNAYYLASEMTRVLLSDVSTQPLQRYAQIIGVDKAGGYGIQGPGSLLVSKIEGCYYNVMGLPIQKTWELLKKVEIDLWDFI